MPRSTPRATPPAFLAAYDAVLAQWPEDTVHTDLTTPYGRTHVHGTGPEGAPPVLLRVEEGAKELGQAHFGPLIEGSVALLRAFDGKERAAVRGFLTGVRDLLAAPQGPAPDGPATP